MLTVVQVKAKLTPTICRNYAFISLKSLLTNDNLVLLIQTFVWDRVISHRIGNILGGKLHSDITIAHNKRRKDKMFVACTVQNPYIAFLESV